MKCGLHYLVNSIWNKEDFLTSGRSECISSMFSIYIVVTRCLKLLPIAADGKDKQPGKGKTEKDGAQPAHRRTIRRKLWFLSNVWARIFFS
jgi:hypothetical protein